MSTEYRVLQYVLFYSTLCTACDIPPFSRCFKSQCATSKYEHFRISMLLSWWIRLLVWASSYRTRNSRFGLRLRDRDCCCCPYGRGGGGCCGYVIERFSYIKGEGRLYLIKSGKATLGDAHIAIWCNFLLPRIKKRCQLSYKNSNRLKKNNTVISKTKTPPHRESKLLKQKTSSALTIVQTFRSKNSPAPLGGTVSLIFAGPPDAF